MTHIVIFVSTLIGFTGLCAAIPRHQNDLIGCSLSKTHSRYARIAGWSLLILGYGIALDDFGFGYGSVVWVGHLSLAAAFVVARLTWRAHRAKDKKSTRSS